MIYLDNAATTIKKPDAVYDAVLDAMKHCGNSGRECRMHRLMRQGKYMRPECALQNFSAGRMRIDLFLRQIPLSRSTLQSTDCLSRGACDYDTARAQFGAQTSYMQRRGSVRGYCAMQ